jgi:hypothetical protein
VVITETVVGVACILVGLFVIAMHFAPEPPSPLTTPAAHRAQLAHSLGLGHRLAARLVGSSFAPTDENFVTVAALYQLSPLRVTPARVELVTPLLEVEQLLERMERFAARARSWGRRGPR